MNNKLNFNWLFKMAWRDSRRNRSRLLLFITSIIMGVAALVAIYSLGENMRQEVDNQAATLLGADIRIGSNKKVSPGIQKVLDSLGDRRSEEHSFSSMIFFVKTAATRLVQVRAIDGEFPYYGDLETLPAGAGRSFRKEPGVIVDQTLLLQYNAIVGDSVKIGERSFKIVASLISAPGQTGLSASVAPKVYMPLQYLEETGLSQKGSRISYNYYFKFNRKVNSNAIIKKLEPLLEKEGLNYDTIESQKEDTSKSLGDLARFLALVSFIALLLGCVGVASSIHIYVREKINAIAILRCLGAQGSQAFLIYLIQILAIGTIGSVVGAAVGTIIQQFLPLVLKDVLPIAIQTSISWISIGQGIAVGIIISLLFALLPLISIRNISPLNTLRITYQPPAFFRDPVKWLVYVLILLFVFGFSFLQLKSFKQALYFTTGVVVSFLILVATANLLMWTVRRFFPGSWSYLWRQGLANLFRPSNQTTILIVAIGLGTAFICTLITIQSVLLNRMNISGDTSQSNTVLFDIQPAQKDKLVALALQQHLPIQGIVPIINMRLDKMKKIASSTIEKDTSVSMRRSALSREYRVTFRDTLTASEKITKGKWSGTVANDGRIYISIEERFATRNNINLGDTMVFNVQGAVMETIVGSFREVDFNRIETNFLVVFPKGVLEEAPRFYVLLTRIADKAASARFQQLVVQQFPNISIIDLSLVLSVLNDLLRKIAFIIRFMAGFSILTGIIVLIASVLISKYQRMGESVLLRTLGASRKQIYYITVLEYFFLGALAAFTGILLSLASSWALAVYIFKSSFRPQVIPLLFVFTGICMLTVIIGLLNSRDVVTRSPLEVLREEA